MPKYFLAGKRWIGWMILSVAIAVDLVALMTYVQLYPKIFPDKVVPTRLNPSYTHQAIIPDYQNPRLLPIREFLNVDSRITSPVIYYDACMYGAFYQYTPIGRFFRPWEISFPIPAEYKNLYPDDEIQQYLIKNPRGIYFADYAFDSSHIKLADILHYNLEQRVIMVDPEKYNKDFIKTTDKVYIAPMNFKEKFYDASFNWKQARIHKSPAGWEYTLDLPKDFPSYLSTTVFTGDYASWKLTIGNRLLDAMQGKLSAPYTYDVQNIQEGKLTVFLPGAGTLAEDIKLQVKLPDRILNVWKNNFDDFGFAYQAPYAGWLVFNYPYDPKWELSIDGHKTPISRVNRYFIGAPILAGEHQILLRYWPYTSLRFWVFISMLLSVVCFFGIVIYTIKREGFNREGE